METVCACAPFAISRWHLNREDGEAAFAKRLGERATELLKEAATLANCSS
jgi:hypothetical protein